MTAEADSAGESSTPVKDQPEPTIEVAPELRASAAEAEKAPQTSTAEAEKAPQTSTAEAEKAPRTSTAEAEKAPQTSTAKAEKAPRTSTAEAEKASQTSTAAVEKKPYAADAGEPLDEEHPPGRGRPALWVWILGGLIALSILLLIQDFKNRDRFLLVCTHSGQELHRGRRFPWPFGHLAVGGPELKPIPQASEQDCSERSFASELEAREAFLDVLLARARSELAQAAETTLPEVRREAKQALLLTEQLPHRKREVQHLLAQVSYKEGKAGLKHAEQALRLALSRFQEAQKLDGDHFDDLEEWISHLEQMLRALAPSPFAAPQPPPGPLPWGKQQPTSQPSQPLAPTPHLGRGRPARDPDAGPAPRRLDAGTPEGTSGILM